MRVKFPPSNMEHAVRVKSFARPWQKLQSSWDMVLGRSWIELTRRAQARTVMESYLYLGTQGTVPGNPEQAAEPI